MEETDSKLSFIQDEELHQQRVGKQADGAGCQLDEVRSDEDSLEDDHWHRPELGITSGRHAGASASLEEKESNSMSAGSTEENVMRSKGTGKSSASGIFKGAADIGDTSFDTLSQNSGRPPSSSQHHKSMARPRETKASQLRAKTYSVTDTKSPQKLNLGRQSSLSIDKTSPTSRSYSAKDVSSPDRLRSRSTSSDNSAEWTSDKELDTNSDFKSKERWTSQTLANQSSTSRSVAPTQFAETHQLFGTSGSSTKTTPPAVCRLNLKTQEHVDSSQPVSKGFSHVCYSPYGPTEKYLTPLQQKERQNKELNVKLTKMEQKVQDKDDRIGQFEEEKQEALDELRKVKDIETGKLLIEIKNLQMKLRQSECSLAEMTDSFINERKTTASLEEQIAAMKKEQEEREAVHQKRYLEMYQKGREAQLIDQEEDLICRAIGAAPDGDSPTRHLVKKLEETEKELEKLRQTFREDVYHKSPSLDTDSAAQVEILKSAAYYYLTDTQPDVNLKVMLSMLNYSDVQKKNIISHLKKKKSK